MKFPDNLIWEDTTSGGTGLYKGKAAVIFPPTWTGQIESVTLQGEAAQKAELYNDHQVFRFLKEGSGYANPKQLKIKLFPVDYTYDIDPVGAEDPTEPTDPSAYKKWTRNLYDSSGYKGLRTTEVGSFFGKSIRFEFPNGFKLTIEDTLKRYEKGNRKTIYRHGGKGLTPSSEQYTSHGGMGLWTQEAGNSKTVDIIRLK